MNIEAVTTLFLDAANGKIANIEEWDGDSGLTSGQSDAIRSIRYDLREILSALSNYYENLTLKEAIRWVGLRLKCNENAVFEEVRRDLFELNGRVEG